MNKFWKNIGQVYWDVPAIEGAGGGGGDEIGGDIGSVIEGAIADQGEVKPDPGADPNEEAEIGKLAEEWAKANPNARGHIKIDRHQAVLTRTRNQHQKALEEWAAKEKAWQEREAAIKKQEEEWKQYEWAKDPDIGEALQALALANSDQKKFVELLLQDERFASLIQLKEAQAAGQIPADRPKPNQKSEDGAYEYYDDAGLDALLKWHSAQSEKAIAARIEQQMEQKYGKVAQAFEATTVWNQQLAEAKVKLDEMRQTWPEFAKYENEIKAYMDKPGNEKVSVDEAYRVIVTQRLLEREKVNRETLRKEILEELKGKKPAAEAVEKAKPVDRKAEPAGDVDIADVIRESIRNIKE